MNTLEAAIEDLDAAWQTILTFDDYDSVTTEARAAHADAEMTLAEVAGITVPEVQALSAASRNLMRGRGNFAYVMRMNLAALRKQKRRSRR